MLPVIYVSHGSSLFAEDRINSFSHILMLRVYDMTNISKTEFYKRLRGQDKSVQVPQVSRQWGSSQHMR